MFQKNALSKRKFARFPLNSKIRTSSNTAMKISCLLFFTLFLISSVPAQSEIKGKLVDQTTGEPIPFGHISFLFQYLCPC